MPSLLSKVPTKKNLVNVMARVKPEFRDKVNAAARKNGHEVQNIIITALEEYLKESGKKNG